MLTLADGVEPDESGVDARAARMARGTISLAA
jgi:hypothetical protein